jgi:hypothetical protein
MQVHAGTCAVKVVPAPAVRLRALRMMSHFKINQYERCSVISYVLLATRPLVTEAHFVRFDEAAKNDLSFYRGAGEQLWHQRT